MRYVQVFLLVLLAPQPAPSQTPPPAQTVSSSRHGPDHHGYYDFGFLTSNGIHRQESGNPLPGQNYAVAGSYSFKSPDGKLVDVEYASDNLGYRVHNHNNGGLPPLPPHARRQIQRAKLAFARKGEVYSNAYSLPGVGSVVPHAGHLPQGTLAGTGDRLASYKAFVIRQRRINKLRQDELDRQALVAKLAQERRQRLLAEERRRLLEFQRLQDDRKAFEAKRLDDIKRLEAERVRLQTLLADTRRHPNDPNRLAIENQRLLLAFHENSRRTGALQRLERLMLQKEEKKLLEQPKPEQLLKQN